MNPGDKVRNISETKFKNEIGIIKRIEMNTRGHKICVVNCVEGDLWTDHGRVEDNENRWSAEHCEVIHESR